MCAIILIFLITFVHSVLSLLQEWLKCGPLSMTSTALGKYSHGKLSFLILTQNILLNLGEQNEFMNLFLYSQICLAIDVSFVSGLVTLRPYALVSFFSLAESF